MELPVSLLVAQGGGGVGSHPHKLLPPQCPFRTLRTRGNARLSLFGTLAAGAQCEQAVLVVRQEGHLLRAHGGGHLQGDENHAALARRGAGGSPPRAAGKAHTCSWTLDSRLETAADG